MSRSSLSVFAVACAFAALPAADAAAASEAAGRLAHGGDQTDIWWSRHLDGTDKRRFLYRATDVSFSADGRRLAYVRLSPTDWAGVGVANGDGGFPAWVIRPFDKRIPDMTDTFEVAIRPYGASVVRRVRLIRSAPRA